MNQVLALECVVMGEMLLGMAITWYGYSRDKKRRQQEKSKK